MHMKSWPSYAIFSIFPHLLSNLHQINTELSTNIYMHNRTLCIFTWPKKSCLFPHWWLIPFKFAKEDLLKAEIPYVIEMSIPHSINLSTENISFCNWQTGRYKSRKRLCTRFSFNFQIFHFHFFYLWFEEKGEGIVCNLTVSHLNIRLVVGSAGRQSYGGLSCGEGTRANMIHILSRFIVRYIEKDALPVRPLSHQFLKILWDAQFKWLNGQMHFAGTPVMWILFYQMIARPSVDVMEFFLFFQRIENFHCNTIW